MKLFVGLVTYGEYSLKYLEENLSSLRAALGFLSQDMVMVGVFDNSEPGDLGNYKFIIENYQEFKIFSQNKNLGFARAYNFLIREAQKNGAEYFLMLNPDIILAPDMIEKLLTVLENNGSLASVAPKLYRWPFPNKPTEKIIDTCGLILLPGLRFVDLGQGKVDNGIFDQAEILGPSGAAGLFRLSSLEKVSFVVGSDRQYFDERMFMYKEDCDLAYRLFLDGQLSALVSGAIAWHDRSAASQGEGWFACLRSRNTKSKLVRRWSFVSQHLIFAKHFKRQGFSSKLRILLASVSMLVFALAREHFLLVEYSNILSKIRQKNKD